MQGSILMQTSVYDLAHILPNGTRAIQVATRGGADDE